MIDEHVYPVAGVSFCFLFHLEIARGAVRPLLVEIRLIHRSMF